MYAKLGNVAAKEAVRKGAKITWKKIKGDQITTLTFGPDTSVDVALIETADAWKWHSDKNPAWVESDNEDLGGRLAAYFGCIVKESDED